MERLFVLMDSNSLSVDFDDLTPREKTIDLLNHVLRDEWDSAGYATKTSVKDLYDTNLLSDDVHTS